MLVVGRGPGASEQMVEIIIPVGRRLLVGVARRLRPETGRLSPDLAQGRKVESGRRLGQGDQQTGGC